MMPFVSDFVTATNLYTAKRNSGVQTSTLPRALTPELTERLLGKSPLRLVSARQLAHKGCWKETLECGHEVYAFIDFFWDAKSHLILLEPSAKRRRCRACQEIALGKPKIASGEPRPPQTPVQSGDDPLAPKSVPSPNSNERKRA